MSQAKKLKVEFGDFQTPNTLAQDVCAKLLSLGYSPEAVVEPTCGLGAFVIAASEAFNSAREVLGVEINDEYLSLLRRQIAAHDIGHRVRTERSDFFEKDWKAEFSRLHGRILVIGNLPWVTNSTQGQIGGKNLPEKSNFLNHVGFDAITGKSNFDISEWMLLEIFRSLKGRDSDVAMLVKSAVARKVLSHLERQGAYVSEASIYAIDAKRDFDASVDACLLVVRLSAHGIRVNHDYSVYASLHSAEGKRVGHRNGLTVCDLDSYESLSFLVGNSPEKWRSGIKHDASAVMEITRTTSGMCNGLGEHVDIEDTHMFPLLKGSDVGSAKEWRNKFVLVTQRSVGESTEVIRKFSPRTWSYLEAHGGVLDARASIIYKKNPRFSVFGVGEYAFRPWKIAICSLYKSLGFQLIGPIEGKPVMFDDTVYYLSFESEEEAKTVLGALRSEQATKLLSALIFWDEKRPIKTSLLNVLDWSRIAGQTKEKAQCEMNLTIR